MACQNRNIFNVVRGRESGKRGSYGQNSVACFSEDVAASSIIDNKACALPSSLRSTFLIVFSHDHTLMASSHGNHCIYVTRLTTGQCIQTLEGHPRTPWCVTFHPTSNEILASGCLGGEVRVWDLQGSSEVWVSEHCTMIASLAFHPHDQVLAIATDNQILLWDWRQPEPFASVKTTSPLEKVRLVRFDPLGHFMLTGITNVNDDDAEVDVDISTPRESVVSGDNANSESSNQRPSPGSSGRPMDPDSYPNPSQVEPPPPPPPPPPPSLLYGTRRQLSLGTPSSSSSTSGRPPSPDSASRVSDAQDYAAAVTLSALGLRRVSSRQYRAQRENDANRLRGRRSYTSFEEARFAHRSGPDPDAELVVYTEQPSASIQRAIQHRRARLHRYLGPRMADDTRERSDRNRNDQNSEEPPIASRREEPLYIWTSGESNPSERDSSGIEQERSSTSSAAPPAAHESSTSNSSSSNANVPSANINVSVDSTTSSSSSANQSPRSVRRPRFVRSSPSSTSSCSGGSFEIFRRGRHSAWISRTYEGSSESRLSRPQPELGSADSERTSTPNTSGGPARQTNVSQADPSDSSASPSASPSMPRRHRAAWEAGHASHWRRIESRQTLNPDIVPPGVAHTAHLGRVPDTPPPSTSEPSAERAEVPSTSEMGREGSSVEAEVAERRRPTLLMASPSSSIPSATTAAALPTSSYSARRTIPALLHHGHARRHMYHMGQDRPLRRERDESGSPGGPETRRARLSRYGFSRTSLGRRTSQAALHRHYARHSSIFDEENRPPSSSIHHYINRAIANAFAGRGETAVANNIGNTTYRLQWWDFQDFQLPDISRAETNVVVPHCKLHNDASCDISQDGSLLAVFVPSPLGFPDDGVLAIYSLKQHNFGDAVYTKSFGPNAITVSLSPLGGYVMVGLAARKLHWHLTTKQLMAQIFRLAKPGTEDSLVHIMDVKHPSDADRRSQISVNIAKWLPQPGRGFVYGTNRGHLRICTPRYMPSAEADEVPANDADSQSSDDDMYSRHINLVGRRRSYQELRSLAMRLHPPVSLASSSASSSGGSMPERRARGTQTARRIQFSIATQTDDVSTHNTSAQSSSGVDAREGTGSNTTSSSAGQTDTNQTRTDSSAPSTSRDTSVPSTSRDTSAPSTSRDTSVPSTSRDTSVPSTSRDTSAPSTSRDTSTQIVRENMTITTSTAVGNEPSTSEESIQHSSYGSGTAV